MKRKEHQIFARFYNLLTDKQTIYILKTLTKQQIQIILDIIHNIVNGTCPVNDKTKLVKYKGFIRKLVAKGLTLKKRRNYISKIRKILPVFFQAYIEYESRIDFDSESEMGSDDDSNTGQ